MKRIKMVMPLVLYHPREWDEDWEVFARPSLSSNSNNRISDFCTGGRILHPLSCGFKYVWSSAFQRFVLHCGFQRDKVLKLWKCGVSKIFVWLVAVCSGPSVRPISKRCVHRGWAGGGRMGEEGGSLSLRENGTIKHEPRADTLPWLI